MIDKMNLEQDLDCLLNIMVYTWHIEQQSVEKLIWAIWPKMNDLENYKVTLDLHFLGHQLAIL